MLPILIKFTSLAVNLAIVIFVIQATGKPNTHHRSLQMLAGIALILAVPVAVLMALCVVQGLWAGLLFLSALSNVAFVSAATGYGIGQAMKTDPFPMATGGALLSLLLFGGFLGAMILP